MSDSRNDIHIEVRKAPFLDTGIGREAGYANDEEFIAAVEAECARLSPDLRRALEVFEAEVERRFLLGDAGVEHPEGEDG